MKSLKVLISAYACKPNEGSEPGVGWNTIREIVKYHQVWVLTRLDNQSVIEAELEQNPIPNLHFIYCQLPFWAKSWKSTRPHHYYLWQIYAYFVARKLNTQVGLDVAHHVTYVRYWSPSFLSFLPIPFIWGPVGGGEALPKGFIKDFSLRGKIYETLRYIAHIIGEHDPFTRLTAKKSTIVRAVSHDTANRLYNIGVKKLEVYSALGLTQQEIDSLNEFPIPKIIPSNLLL